jgi:transcriptional regulator with XRE-family HTH domain
MLSAVPRAPKPDPALASALRRLREDRALTREALAFHAGLTTGSLARIELAQSSPGWDTIRRVAKALGVSLAELAAAVEAAELASGAAS